MLEEQESWSRNAPSLPTWPSRARSWIFVQSDHAFRVSTSRHGRRWKKTRPFISDRPLTVTCVNRDGLYNLVRIGSVTGIVSILHRSEATRCFFWHPLALRSRRS